MWVRCGGAEKERATLMLLGDSDGNKFDPFVVFKATPSKLAHVDIENHASRHGFGVRLWKELNEIQQSTAFVIYGNSKGVFGFIRHAQSHGFY